MAIASTSNGHNVQPPPGPAQAPVRTIAAELTDEQRPNGAREVRWRQLLGQYNGTEFDAEEFLRQHPQWDWQRGYLKDRPQQPWTHVEPGSTSGP